MMVSDVCLSRTSGLSREQRDLARPTFHRGSPHDTWLGHHFQGQRSRSPGRFTQHSVYTWGSRSGECGTVFTVGFSAHGGGEGRGHIVAATHLQLVNNVPVPSVLWHCWLLTGRVSTLVRASHSESSCTDLCGTWNNLCNSRSVSW